MREAKCQGSLSPCRKFSRPSPLPCIDSVVEEGLYLNSTRASNINYKGEKKGVDIRPSFGNPQMFSITDYRAHCLMMAGEHDSRIMVRGPSSAAY